MAAEEAPNVDLITLTRHVLSDQFRLGPSATGDLTLLLTAIQVTSKFIATNVRKARLINLVGLAGETNVQGEEQKKLDVLSNDIMVNALRASRKTAVLVSEELDDAIIIEEPYRGAYCVVFDPLDGSSNIDAGVNIGTIFGIYKIQPSSKGSIEDVLRPGSEMVAAGYTMYGSSANLVLSTGQGVNGYTLDAALGEFILTHPDIKIPPRGKIYSFNEGNSMYFHPPVINYLNSIKYPPHPKTPYSARYIGSMVADVHRTLLYGGIFGYPDDKKSKSGKLRLLYEAFPMAFLIEQVVLTIFVLEARDVRMKRPKRLVLSDEEEGDGTQDDIRPPSPTLSFSPTSTRRSQTLANDSGSEHDPEFSPHSPESPPPPSSSRIKRAKGHKSNEGPPTKKKKKPQRNMHDHEEYHSAAASGDDEDTVVTTKRQPKLTLKVQAMKGKEKSSTGTKADTKTGRVQRTQVQESNQKQGVKRARSEISKPEDSHVDIIGDTATEVAVRSLSPPKEPVQPPPKRRKLPTIKKNKGVASSLDVLSPQMGASAVKVSDILKPNVQTRVTPLMAGNTDFDLRDENVYKSLFTQSGGNAGVNKEKEERRKELDKLRDEARTQRTSEMATSFDLQTQFEKIKRFEETLGRCCWYPNVLAAKWKEIYDRDKTTTKQGRAHEEGQIRIGSETAS
ncbi:hypothetical protein H0H93_001555 [Arthromyces matolae]|nr:hypothetical protein H0H93_001555 [Arthromyces matolae]